MIYGIYIFSNHSGTRFFLVWFLLAALMFVLGLSGCTSLIPVLLKRIMFVLMIALAVLVAVTWSMILTQFHSKGEAHLDYIVVLGAQVRNTGPSQVLRYRLDTACRYLQENPETKCIVSGGKGANEPEAEGTAMKRYLLKHGVSKNRIETETKSLNTVQNLLYSGEKMEIEQDRIGIVTNNFHLFRAVHIAKKNGYRYVSGIAAPSDPGHLLNNMLRETFGIVKDTAGGNLV